MIKGNIEGVDVNMRGGVQGVRCLGKHSLPHKIYHSRTGVWACDVCKDEYTTQEVRFAQVGPKVLVPKSISVRKLNNTEIFEAERKLEEQITVLSNYKHALQVIGWMIENGLAKDGLDRNAEAWNFAAAVRDESEFLTRNGHRKGA